MDCDFDKVVFYVILVCILYNMCEERKECYFEEWNRLGEDEIGDLFRLDSLNDDNDVVYNVVIIRNVLVYYLFN